MLDRVRGQTHFWQGVVGKLWLLGLVVLPIYFDATRVESFESPKATLAILIGVALGVAAIFVWRSVPHAGRRSYLRHPLTLAIFAWAVCSLCSAILSLSPTRSLLGDLYRRMGFLTQLSLLVAFAGGSLLTRYHRRLSWSMLAIAGIVVAVYGILERLGLSPFVAAPALRPSSTLGVHVRAASWCIIVLIWLASALALHRKRAARLFLIAFIVGLIFLILTQSRGAALGLLAGLIALGILWGWTHQRRWLLYGLGSSTIAITVLGVGLYTLDWRGSSLRQIPLIGRLTAATDGETSVFRLLLWQSVGQAIHDWPTLTAVRDQPEGQPDPLARLRPVFGYGQEMFEILEHQYFNDQLQSTDPAKQVIDRAHNIWLDTLITQGGAGLLSLMGVYLAATWTCFRVLRQQHQQAKSWGERGWIAAMGLAVLIAHLVDLQFTFATVASEWLFWATLGVLLNIALQPMPLLPAESQPYYRVRLWPVGIVITGSILGWALAAAPITGHSVIMASLLTLSLVVLLWVMRIRYPIVPTVCIAVVAVVFRLGIGSSSTARVLISQAVDWLAVGAAIAVCIWTRRPNRLQPRLKFLSLALLVSIAGVWRMLDADADSLLQLANNQTNSAKQATIALSAVALKPNDDQLLSYASNAAFWAGSHSPDQQSYWLSLNVALMGRASAVNAYDATLTVQRAYYFAFLALDDVPQRQDYLENADRFYTLAVQQWPTDPGLRLEWARFVLDDKQEPQRAILLAEQIEKLTPNGANDAAALISNAQKMLDEAK